MMLSKTLTPLLGSVFLLVFQGHKNPSLKMLKKVAEAYGLKVGKLFRFE
jgi:hypothetical protein